MKKKTRNLLCTCEKSIGIIGLIDRNFELDGENMKFSNVYFINGTAYAGKSTMVKMLAEKYNGIACEENYHDARISELDSCEFPGLTYTRL